MINSVLILRYIRDNNYSKLHFAKKCKMGICQLNKILSKKDICPIIPLYKIARIMNVYIKDLYLAE